MKNGYHQVPLREDHRYLTCLSTPRGTMQCRVLVMGLKNGNAIFQRVMEEVMEGIDYADAYVDDLVLGSTTVEPFETLLKEHDKVLRRALDRLIETGMVVNEKAQPFVQEVKFCGHILREGKRFPAPDRCYQLKTGNWHAH